MELLDSNEDESTRRAAADSLGDIGTGNEAAIAALVELLGSTKNGWIRHSVASFSMEIFTGNETAIAALVELLESTEDEKTRRRAADSLYQIWSPHNFAQVVTGLKDSLNNSQRFNKDCYGVIWHCAQNMTYPAFYQAWHKNPLDSLTNFLKSLLRRLLKTPRVGC